MFKFYSLQQVRSNKCVTIKIITFQVSYINSDLVQETWVELKDKDDQIGWGSYVVRNYLAEQHTEVEWLVGPIPGLDGKEVVMTYNANPFRASSDGKEEHVEFFTDSNGRQNVKRVKDKRSSFDFTDHDVESDPITSNYYPITTGSFNHILIFFLIILSR